MISSTAHYSSAILAYLLVSLLIAPSSAISQADVNAVCSNALSPAFCLSYLNSIPGLAAAKFPDLVRTAIKAAQDETQKALKLAKSLAEQTKDPLKKVAVERCFVYYNQEVMELLMASRSLAAVDRLQLKLSAFAGIPLGMSCQRQIAGTGIPLEENNLSIENYSSVLAQLADRV